MTGRIDVVATGRWRCSCGEFCEQQGQFWAGCDLTQHPGIRDLDRLLKSDNHSNLRFNMSWSVEDQRPLLQVVITSPIRLTFAVRFTLPEHAELLAEVADNGYFMLCHVVPGSTPVIAFSCDGAASDQLDRLLSRGGDETN